MEKLSLYRRSYHRCSDPKPSEDREFLQQPLPNSTVLRIMNDSEAENEADRLSKGVVSRTPDGLRAEMGSRLGTDFSGVKFHTDSACKQQSRAIGARAWTRGNDIYFGRGGFAPEVAAHELVHTVQQGATHGSVSASVPYGSIQRLADDEDEAEDGSLRGSGPERIEAAVINSFSTSLGKAVYKGIESKIKNMIGQVGKKKVDYQPERGIRFMVRAAYQDYTAREILEEIAAKPISSRRERDDRIREYRALIDNVSARLGEFLKEELAAGTQLIPGQSGPAPAGKPQYGKRAYEHAADNSDATVSFNPGNSSALSKVQAEIDQAQSAQEAYRAFAKFSGNPQAAFSDKTDELRSGNFDLKALQRKLKQMSRMILDYPELRNQIGDMVTLPLAGSKEMNVDTQFAKDEKFTIGYRPDQTPSAGTKREENPSFISPRDYHGTHELGHILGLSLIDRANMPQESAYDIAADHAMEDDILKGALLKNNGALAEAYGLGQNGRGIHYDRSGMIDTERSFLGKKITSRYGRTNPAEFFAESVADIYSHGNQAKQSSVGVVKEYEERMKKKEREKFDRSKNKLSFFERLKRFFFRW